MRCQARLRIDDTATGCLHSRSLDPQYPPNESRAPAAGAFEGRTACDSRDCGWPGPGTSRAVAGDPSHAPQAARAGTPGIVSGIHFDSVMNTSFRAKWSPPSNGGQDLTGYGLLWWTGHVEHDRPGYGDATTIGVPPTFRENGIKKQAQTLSGLSSGTTYHFLMHACNPNGCGHWSYPAKQVTTTGTPPLPVPPPTTAPPPPVPAPHRPHTIMFHDTTSTSVRVTWSAADNTGGVPLTGFDLRYWPFDSHNPNSEAGATTQRADGGNDESETVRGLAANTEYELKMRACNQPNNTNCSRWSDDHRFTTSAGAVPPPGAPSFGSVVSWSHNFVVGQTVSVTLPTASGGTGVLRYSLAPLVGNGVTFDGATRTVSGTPQAAANLATYTYTVTDAANKTTQIPFHVTVFDVNVQVKKGNVLRPLPQSEWGVLDYAVLLPEAGFTRTDGHQFRLRLPASTGFQFGRACRWPAVPPTATTMLESPWMDSPRGLDLVRCGLGAGARVSFEVEVRRGTGGTAGSLYTATTTVKRSWHRHDRRVLYFITGTLANGEIDGGQMFPANASMTPHRTLTDRLNYHNAAKAWENAPSGGVTLDRLLTNTGPDVVISGYWDPGAGNADLCGGSVACTYGAGTYPHLGNGQVFLIEDPPRWPDDDAGSDRKWTTEIAEWQADKDGFEYLPRILMHEFGHTLGLGHSADSSAIMDGLVSPNLADTDIMGLKATYAHHLDDH